MLPFFPRDVLDELLDLIESVSGGGGGGEGSYLLLNKVIRFLLNEIFVVLISFLIFLFYSAKYWEEKMISRLNDVFVV